MVVLTQQKETLLKTDGHLLALGGPGSGKTFIALLKADMELQKGKLLQGQNILFLSFARATIARVAQQAKVLISNSHRSELEMNTYHGFTWNVLRSHGYLLRNGKPLHLLPPPEAASRLADIDADAAAREAEKKRLFWEEGLLHFDLFAAFAGELLGKSKALARIICDTYPIIILDEFQDTNADEWRLIRILGERSRLIALADAEQRIYEFRGADPKRIGEFIEIFAPTQFDFASENNRSNGTDIALFGNDLLSGANKTKNYTNVSVMKYQVRRGALFHFDLKFSVLQAIQRLKKLGQPSWSLAVLVPTKQLMIEISDYLLEEQVLQNGRKYPSISHDVALETTGPSLAAIIIASLMEGAATQTEIAHRMITNLCGHIRGRKGNDPVAQGELQLAGALDNFIGAGAAIKGSKRKLVVDECMRIADARRNLHFSGDPSQDWLTVRHLLSSSTAETIQKVSEDAKYLRLLHKGALLSSRLSELWRKNGNYSGAVSLVQDALLQEHFSASTKEWTGIHVMTIHKSKGKEFDEIIVYEGAYQKGRIIRGNATPKEIAQSRLTLRVAVTRARKHSTILTPKHDVCGFL